MRYDADRGLVLGEDDPIPPGESQQELFPKATFAAFALPDKTTSEGNREIVMGNFGDWVQKSP